MGLISVFDEILIFIRRLFCSLLIVWPLSPLQAAEEEQQPFARVNGELLTMEQFQEAYIVGAREKFYHGRPPEEDLLEYRVEAGVELVNKTLLLQEAKRRGLEPDEEWVSERVGRQVERLKSDPRWEVVAQQRIWLIRPPETKEEKLKKDFFGK